MTIILAAIGLALALEGLFYAIAPERAKDMARFVLQADPNMLRRMGLGCAVLGSILVFIAGRVL